jgi:DNA-binding transcriptional LysR family regulator
VAEDKADVGLISCPQQTRTLKAVPWLDEPIVLVCSPAHLLARRKSLRLAELNGLEIVGFDADLPIRRLIDRELLERRVQLHVAATFDNIDTIKRALEVNAGVSLLPEPTVRRELEAGTLATVRVQGLDLVRPLGIIYHRGVELGTTARRFVQMLEETAAGAAPCDPASRRDGRRTAAGSAADLAEAADAP